MILISSRYLTSKINGRVVQFTGWTLERIHPLLHFNLKGQMFGEHNEAVFKILEKTFQLSFLILKEMCNPIGMLQARINFTVH